MVNELVVIHPRRDLIILSELDQVVRSADQGERLAEDERVVRQRRRQQLLAELCDLLDGWRGLQFQELSEVLHDEFMHGSFVIGRGNILLISKARESEEILGSF